MIDPTAVCGMPVTETNVIDADAHVVETERVWDFLDAADERFRPTLTTSPQDPQRQIWILDGENLGSKFPSPDEKQSREHVRRFGREVGTPVGGQGAFRRDPAPAPYG